MATDNMHSKEEKRRKNKQATTGCQKKKHIYFQDPFGNHFTCPLGLLLMSFELISVHLNEEIINDNALKSGEEKEKEASNYRVSLPAINTNL